MSAEFTKEQMADIVDGLVKSSYDFIPRVRRVKCSTCQKLNRGTTTCEVYPDEIPNDIILERTPCEEYRENPSEEKGYLYAEAANGLMVRVPEDRYEDWKKEQDEIRAEEERKRQRKRQHAEELREAMLDHELKRMTDPEYRKKSDKTRALFKKYLWGYGKKEL